MTAYCRSWALRGKARESEVASAATAGAANRVARKDKGPHDAALCMLRQDSDYFLAGAFASLAGAAACAAGGADAATCGAATCLPFAFMSAK